MKHLKSYIIIAILTLSVASAHNASANSVAPVRGIDVIVKKNPGPARRAIASPNGDGTYTVQLSVPGNYTISYASGPKKGQVIKQVTVHKAGATAVVGVAAVKSQGGKQ